MATARFGFPFIAADQAQKHVTHNAALDLIDATIAGLVASATTASAPASPGEGDAYLLPVGAEGFGPAVAGDVATFTGGEWIAAKPYFGRRVYALDAGQAWVYGGAKFGWLPGDVAAPSSGATLALSIREATLSPLSGGSATAGGLIPTGAIVLGVSSKTTAAITGATSYMVGLSAGGSEFGNGLGISPGSTNLGMVGPFAVYSDTDVTVTPNGGNFTGGAIRLAAHLIVPTMTWVV